jgi:hypothetical protein
MELLSQSTYRVFTSVIDKKEHASRYGASIPTITA